MIKDISRFSETRDLGLTINRRVGGTWKAFGDPVFMLFRNSVSKLPKIKGLCFQITESIRLSDKFDALMNEQVPLKPLKLERLVLDARDLEGFSAAKRVIEYMIRPEVDTVDEFSFYSRFGSRFDILDQFVAYDFPQVWAKGPLMPNMQKLDIDLETFCTSTFLKSGFISPASIRKLTILVTQSWSLASKRFVRKLNN